MNFVTVSFLDVMKVIIKHIIISLVGYLIQSPFSYCTPKSRYHATMNAKLWFYCTYNEDEEVFGFPATLTRFMQYLFPFLSGKLRVNRVKDKDPYRINVTIFLCENKWITQIIIYLLMSQMCTRHGNSFPRVLQHTNIVPNHLEKEEENLRQRQVVKNK